MVVAEDESRSIPADRDGGEGENAASDTGPRTLSQYGAGWASCFAEDLPEWSRARQMQSPLLQLHLSHPSPQRGAPQAGQILPGRSDWEVWARLACTL